MNAPIVDTLLAFLAQEGCTDEQFDALALRLFAEQHAGNAAFRRFCQLRGATPRSVKSWRDIPAVPINAFKDATLSCAPADTCERVFMTSGTTRGDVKGRHYDIPVVVGALAGSQEIYSIGLGCEPDDVLDRWQRALNNPIEPVIVEFGPVQEVGQRARA